jgi:hypothetical protein
LTEVIIIKNDDDKELIEEEDKESIKEDMQLVVQLVLWLILVMVLQKLEFGTRPSSLSY